MKLPILKMFCFIVNCMLVVANLIFAISLTFKTELVIQLALFPLAGVGQNSAVLAPPLLGGSRKLSSEKVVAVEVEVEVAVGRHTGDGKRPSDARTHASNFKSCPQFCLMSGFQLITIFW